MACDCSKYIDCGDPKITVGTADDRAGYTHSYNNEVKVTNLPYLFTFKVKRAFSVDYGWDRDINISHILKDCASTNYQCDSTSKATANCTQSEDCTIESNVPYHIDRQREIYVWKNIKEEVKWKADSGGKTAQFKLKFGTGYFHKICIKKSVKAKGTEKFLMSKGGVITTLAEQSYEYNPFPETEGGGATWGLYGNTVQRSSVPDTPDVSCILLFPTVPKQAIPQDNDVIAYGFYDYNAIEGGFVESSLPKDDGGKDYFYPYWCRGMPHDVIWRATADDRHSIINSAGKLILTGTTPWTPPTPTVNELPFGSFCMDNEDAFVASALLQFGSRLDNKGVVYNQASFGDLFKALTANKITLGSNTKLDPVSLI